MDVVIDFSKANLKKNMLFRGNGMVSANNSSRLLLDYKAEHLESYYEILNLIFGKDGLDVNHLKIEMGSDINSSSGTEPCIKRSPNETADVTRGAGFQLCADAKKIKPNLTTDMLWWSEPKWVSSSENVYNARYKWYKETLDAAWKTYGLKFDYVSATQNERTIDFDWIKYLSKKLKSEKDCPYDYSKIKISAADEVCTWTLADAMLKDEELMKAVDVVGSHYTSFSSENAQRLAYEKEKELWLSEGSPPATYSRGAFRFDESNSGMNDVNGVLDVANRFIAMYSCGRMTLYQYQPIVAAYYDGVTYCQKQFILSNTPWSGDYSFDSGFYMALHFSRFIKKGWSFIDEACFSDGEAGGDGHAIVGVKHAVLTACDNATGDFSVVITNTTSTPLEYNFTLKNVVHNKVELYVIETSPPKLGSKTYYENYFKHIQTIKSVDCSCTQGIKISVKPYSIVTLSTLDNARNVPKEPSYTDTLLRLPYTDDFEYKNYPEEYLSSRGGAPRFFTDQGGAFEVISVKKNGEVFNAVQQKISLSEKANEWGFTPDPITTFGDDRWFNYSVESEVKISPNGIKSYAGIAIRYVLAASGQSGYRLAVYENKRWILFRNGDILKSDFANLDISEWISLRITAVNLNIKAFINGNCVCEYEDNKNVFCGAGRAALFCSWDRAMFRALNITPVGDDYFCHRFDNTDFCFSYSGKWEHETCGSFMNYKRTSSCGKRNAVAKVDFFGKGILLCGKNDQARVEIKIDGKLFPTEKIEGTSYREAFLFISNLERKEHKLELKVIDGAVSLDCAEII